MTRRDSGSRDDSDDRSVDSPSELADRVDELESTVRDLQKHAVRPPRGPFGVPRPPTPQEFIEFTDRHAIPATVAVLEANIKALQALQATLRLIRGVDEGRERAADTRARTAELGSKTLDALDSALDELEEAYESGKLPDDSTAKSVLLDAQRLTDEIRAELSGTRATNGRTTISIQGDEPGSTRGESTSDPRVDPEEVETELDVLRDEYGNDEDGGTDAEDGGRDDTGADDDNSGG